MVSGLYKGPSAQTGGWQTLWPCSPLLAVLGKCLWQGIPSGKLIALAPRRFTASQQPPQVPVRAVCRCLQMRSSKSGWGRCRGKGVKQPWLWSAGVMLLPRGWGPVAACLGCWTQRVKAFVLSEHCVWMSCWQNRCSPAWFLPPGFSLS